MINSIILIASIFVSIWLISVNIAKLIVGDSIPWPNFIFMSIGLTGVIAHFMGIY